MVESWLQQVTTINTKHLNFLKNELIQQFIQQTNQERRRRRTKRIAGKPDGENDEWLAV